MSQIREMIETIEKSGQRLHRLIENYLAYAQLEVATQDEAKQAALRDVLEKNPCYPAEAIAYAAEQIASDELRVPDLILNLDDVGGQVLADDIKKIAQELVDNAFKFSEPGTPVEITLCMEDDLLTFAIKDEGRGMDTQHIDGIGAFVQFDRKVFEQQGNGLGLIIAKRLTEMNGGTFYIDSQADIGTYIKIQFPKAMVYAESEPLI